MKRPLKLKRLSKKRRKELINKAIMAGGYLLAAAIIIFGTIALVAYGNGYSYDFKKGRLVHRGLVILESTPSGATVTLGDKRLKEKTPYRQSFEEGQYDLMLTKDGFRTWTKRLEVIPSRVNLAQYVILLPQRFQVEEVANFPAVSQSVASRDRRRLALNVPQGPKPGIYVIDTGNRNQTRAYTLSTPQASQPSEVIQVLAWSDDASHLLLKQSIGDKVSHLVVAANGNDPVINLTSTFSTNFDDIRFSLNNWRELYWNSPVGIRRVDLGNQTLSDPLTNKALGLTFAGDRVIYVDGLNPAKPSLWMLERNNRKQQLVEQIPVSASYNLAFSTYINVPQVVLSAQQARVTMLYSDVFDSPTSKQVYADAITPLFNGDGRFVSLYNENSMATFDLELNKLYQFNAPNHKITGLSWFDNYHVQFNRDGQSVLSEFDGNYANTITRGDGQPPTNSSDNKYIYATSQTSSGTILVKALKIKQ